MTTNFITLFCSYVTHVLDAFSGKNLMNMPDLFAEILVYRITQNPLKN